MKYKELYSKSVKFIHILWRSPRIFSQRLINTIVNNDCFNKEDHLFVTNLYELYVNNQDANIVYIKTRKKQPASLVNYACDHCEYLFIHCMCEPPTELLKIRKKNFKKIIWRTWGGDTGYTLKQGEFLKNALKSSLNRILKKRYSSVKAVGVANIVDIVNIEHRYGPLKCFYLGYVDNSDWSRQDFIEKLKKEERVNENTNILLGHSGFTEDNHIEILNRLKGYKDNKINIFIPISYGEKNYTDKLKNYAKNIFDKQVFFIEDMISYKQYMQLLNQMDIAIFDGLPSYALGNIAILVSLHKKIFLNKNGLLHKGFDRDHTPYVLSDVIGEISFDEFKKPFPHELFREQSDLAVKEKDFYLKEWCNTLKLIMNKEDTIGNI